MKKIPKKLLVGLIAPVVAGVAFLVAYSVAMQRRLPKPGRVALDGVTTIEDAVEACRRTGLGGWDLVAYAQHLTARKFTYTRLNTWEPPARAFERGRGFCQQQALALQQIYDRLGFEARPVYAFRCRFGAKVVDGIPWPGGISGHDWLRVKVAGEERDVCPGAGTNRSGQVNFEVLSKVRPLYSWLQPWWHYLSAIENIRRDLVGRCSRPAPANERFAPVKAGQESTAPTE